MFKEIKQNRIFEAVVSQIQESIFLGEYKAGDMLPPERELREIFKISRGTLREALRVLEQKGLIKIKVGIGGGAVVRKANITSATENLAHLILFQKISLEHLYEFRAGLEGDIAVLASQRATKKHIKKLKDLLNELQKIVEIGVSAFDDYLHLDKELHMATAQMASNPVYTYMLNLIHDNIHRFYEYFLPKEKSVMDENYNNYQKIFEAIKKRNANEARALAQDHVRLNYKYMKNKKLPIHHKKEQSILGDRYIQNTDPDIYRNIVLSKKP
jgi:DNA-binding FadR family transcriptional regulator